MPRINYAKRDKEIEDRNIENKKKIEEQKEKEQKAVRKFISKNSYGYEKDYVMIYSNYAEMYKINYYGIMENITTISGKDFEKLNMNFIEQTYNEIK